MKSFHLGIEKIPPPREESFNSVQTWTKIRGRNIKSHEAPQCEIFNSIEAWTRNLRERKHEVVSLGYRKNTHLQRKKH